MTTFEDIVHDLTANLEEAGITVSDGRNVAAHFARITLDGVSRQTGGWKSQLRVDYIHEVEPHRADPIQVERTMHQVIKVINNKTDCLMIDSIQNPRVDANGNLVSGYVATALVSER